MWAGLLLAALIGGDPAGDSQSRELPCPSPAVVLSELARVGVVGVASPTIAVVGDRMRVVLRGRDGAVLGSREVELPLTCHERATVTAVLVATWLGIWPHVPEPALAGPTAITSASPPVSTTTAAQGKTEIGLAVAGVDDGNAAAVGLAIEVRRVLAGGLAAWCGLTATSERNRSVGTATAGYLRPALELGPAFRFGSAGIRAEMGASARLGIALFRGKNLPITHANAHLVPGAAVDMRLVLARKRVSPFIVGTAARWFGRQQLTLDDVAGVTADLPSWDVGLGLGLLWAP